MRKGYTRERGFFLGSAFWESIPKFGGVVLPVKRLGLDSPKKRPTVGPFLPLPKKVNETACIRGSRSWDAFRETGE